jgi:hypothetical protein
VASQMKESVTESASDMATQAGEKMEQAVEMAKHETLSRLDGERERLAESLYTTAHALRQAGQQLREQEQTGIATLTDRVAQRAESASTYLRNRDLSELIDDTEQLGRAHPIIFIGGALGLGMLGVRFLKSSRRQQTATPPQSEAFQALNASNSASTPTGSYTQVDSSVYSPVSAGATASASTSSMDTADWMDLDKGTSSELPQAQVVEVES